MAKTKHGWDWGQFSPSSCGEFVVGHKMIGGKFVVYSCHRKKQTAKLRLRAQARVVAGVKGLLVQLRDKSSGKIIEEKKITAKPKRKTNTPKTKKGPKGLLARLKW